MTANFKLDPGLLAGLDAYRKQQAGSIPDFGREEAVNVIVRDWLQGQGFLPLPGQQTPKTAAESAAVPRGHLDP